MINYKDLISYLCTFRIQRYNFILRIQRCISLRIQYLFKDSMVYYFKDSMAYFKDSMP